MHLQKSHTAFLLPALNATLFGLAFFLAGCGGGGGGVIDPAPSTTPADPLAKLSAPFSNPQGQGNFVSSVHLAITSPAELFASHYGSKLPASAAPAYTVDTYKILYATVDQHGLPATASGLLALPRKKNPGSLPLVSYQHATILANDDAPTVHSPLEEPSVLFASQGFATIAADYIGYGNTSGSPHPYLLSAPAASSVGDFAEAARRFLASKGVALNGELYLTGYSEGGYTTMAALRYFSAHPEIPQPAFSVMGAGSYDVQLTLDFAIASIRSKNALLGAVLNPGFLTLLSASDLGNVRNLLLFGLLGKSKDVTFDPAFLDAYLSDNRALVASQSNVDDFAPNSGVLLFHGKDDQTVTYANTDAAVASFVNKGAGSLVSRADCHESPSDHIPCVAEFLGLAIATFKLKAHGY